MRVFASPYIACLQAVCHVHANKADFNGENGHACKPLLALADAVRVMPGPKSKCVLIGKKWGRPLVCNDVVTIAKEIGLRYGR